MSQNQINSSSVMKVLNPVLAIGFIVTAFLTLTNGIPFIEWGWMGELKSKTRYVNMMRIPVIIFAVVLLGVYFKSREEFHRLGFVRAFKHLADSKLSLVLGVLFVLYSAIAIKVGVTRHLALETRGFDLGIFAQAVWNTLQGDWFYSSLKEGINLMGDHMSPILLITTPFYALWSDPRTLIILQALATATGLFFVAQIAREKFENNLASLLFALCYFFYYPSRAALHEDFHPEVLVEPFIFLAFIFLNQNRIKSFFAMLVLIAMGKENMFGVTFVLGLYAFFFKKMRVVGTTVMVLSVAGFLAVVKVLIPALSAADYFYQGNYIELLSNPTAIANMLSDGDRWTYLFKVYMPFGFLSFAHLPTLILTLPILAQNLLSDNESMRSFSYHYLSGMVPFLFISAIFGLKAILNKFSKLQPHLVLICSVLFVVALIRSGPSEYFYYWNSSKQISDHSQLIRDQLSQIPTGASVLTHNNLIPQVVHRKETHQFDYNTLRTKPQLAQLKKADYVVMEKRFWEPGTEPLENVLAELRKQGYAQAFARDGFYILKK